MSAAVLGLVAFAAITSTPQLGVAAGTCRSGEVGPAIMVSVTGFKDRVGRLRLELYPANDDDFLADDNVLISAGKVFARVDELVPARGIVTLCIRVPAPGSYALMLLHDRDSNHKFGLSTDGIGFAGNPRLGWSKPRAAQAEVKASAGLTHIEIVLNYRRGLAMRPIGAP